MSEKQARKRTKTTPPKNVREELRKRRPLLIDAVANFFQ